MTFLLTERHVSIQATLEDLETLVDLTGGEFRVVLQGPAAAAVTGPRLCL